MGGLSLALLLLVGSAVTVRASESCQTGITPEATQYLFDQLKQPLSEPDCNLESVETRRSELEATWSYRGKSLPPLRVMPRACAPREARFAGPFALVVPGELTDSCAGVLRLLDALARQSAGEHGGPESGSSNDPLFIAARALFLAVFLVTAVLLMRGIRAASTIDRRWLILAIAGFAAALTLRAALPFSLGNWYTQVLPADGAPPWMRFGPGFFAFQSLLRDAGLWSWRSLVLSQLLLGAAAVPLFAAVLRELRVDLNAAAAALVLFVFAPFHARLSATSSEHVLASTLCLALLLAWLRATRSRHGGWMVLSALLVPAVCAVRIEMAAQVCAVLLWPLLRDRGERRTALHGAALYGRVALLASIAAATLAAAYVWIALPSHHPLPESDGQLLALRYVVAQFWLLAVNDPGWMSLSAVILAIPGSALMLLRRPLLLVRVTITLLLAFVVPGRLFLPDELLAARYFLFVIPIVLIIAGFGFAGGLALVPVPRRAIVAAAAIVALGLWTATSGRTAYAVRYAFQDEYTFARRALSRLPDGCAVFQVPLRAQALPKDLDCCLDMPRSPLVLEFPRLHFLHLPKDAGALFDAYECMAYYESIACQIQPSADDPAVRDLAAKAAAYATEACAPPRTFGRLELIDEASVSPRATVNFFHGQPPHARLSLWKR